MADLPPAILLPPNPDVAGVLRARGVRPRSHARGFEPAARYTAPLPGIAPLADSADPEAELLDGLAALLPEAVLLPTSDGLVLAMARFRDAARPLRYASAPPEAIYRLLNKRLLAEACREYAVATPKSLLLDAPEAARLAAKSLRFPVVLKPQTRVGRRHWLRGLVVEAPAELPEAIAAFRRQVTFSRNMLAFDALVRHPIAQEYEAASLGEVYHLCGYLSAAGQHAVRAHVKTLQYPRRFGNALCAEPVAVRADLVDGLLRLCRGVGYHGVFEVEFVRSPGGYQLIDFNPRFYNGMSLELARGLELPWFAYLDAIGDHEALAAGLAAAEADSPTDVVFCRRLLFKVMLLAQAASGGLTPAEAWRWGTWYRRHRRDMVEPTDPGGGRLSNLVYAALTLGQFLRHPRDFAGTFVRRP